MSEKGCIKRLIKKGITAVIIVAAAFALGVCSGGRFQADKQDTSGEPVKESSELLKAENGYDG